jgi:hypothetical protein
MKYKLQKKQSDPENDMRLIDLTSGEVLGYILRWEQCNLFRTTVTQNGIVYGKDAHNIHQSIEFILEKNNLLTEELKKQLIKG